MGKIKILFFVLLLISSTLAHASHAKKSSAVSTGSPEDLFASIEGDFLTVDIKDVALGKVLEEILSKNGIAFSLPDSMVSEEVMVRFSHYTVDKGIRRILAPYNYIFIYDEENGSPEQFPVSRLREVWVYSPSHENNKDGRMKMRAVKPAASRVKKESDKEEGSSVKRAGEKGKSVKTSSAKSLKKKAPGMTLEKVESLVERARDGDQKAIGQLSAALKSNNPEVRKEAEEALKDLGNSLKEESKDNAEPDSDEEDPRPPEKGKKELTLTPGSGNEVALELNNDVPVKAVQFNLEGVKPSDIRTTSRTEGFFAKEHNGRVVLLSLSGDTIAPGAGSIAEIVCDQKGSASLSQIKID